MENKIEFIVNKIAKKGCKVIDLEFRQTKEGNIFFVCYKELKEYEYNEYSISIDTLISNVKSKLIKEDITIASKAITPKIFCCKIKEKGKLLIRYISKNETEAIINAICQLFEIKGVKND